ncbi:MAG: redoxin family protein [Bdellovibrionales bacterium]|nr:redoxin family protein [Bdellovibrionales bacterium]
MRIFLFLLLFSTEAFALVGQDLMTGKAIEVSPGPKGLVAIFMSARCPCSNSHAPMVKELATRFKNFHFVAVNSNSEETVAEARTYFKNFPIPVIRDENNKLANEFKAARTPHAFVISKDGKIAYRGGVTDSSEAQEAKQMYLKDALEALDKDDKVKVAETRSLGCAIFR